MFSVHTKQDSIIHPFCRLGTKVWQTAMCPHKSYVIELEPQTKCWSSRLRTLAFLPIELVSKAEHLGPHGFSGQLATLLSYASSGQERKHLSPSKIGRMAWKSTTPSSCLAFLIFLFTYPLSRFPSSASALQGRTANGAINLISVLQRMRGWRGGGRGGGRRVRETVCKRWS